MVAKRVGLIVPSSNTTMETELPEMFRRRTELFPEERFTFHSSRMRMQHVTPEALLAMDRDSDRCAVELNDAQVDVMAYACLVAIMSQGRGTHKVAEARLANTVRENGGTAPVVSSAGALVRSLKVLGATRVSIITPYMKPLTAAVVDYIEDEGISVKDSISLEVSDNCSVGRLDPVNLPAHAASLDLSGCDALVLSACVQMPSLPSIAVVQATLDIPVLSAATATTYEVLTALGYAPIVPDAGFLLSGQVPAAR
jgi:maleate isomerase